MENNEKYYNEHAFTGPVEGSGGGGGGCFPAGQRVFTSHGWKPIEKLKEGDLVVAFDKFGILDHGKVECLYKHSKEENNSGIFTFTFLTDSGREETIQVTGNHAVYCGDLTESHFREAQEFKVGDVFYGVDEEECTITAIESREINDDEFTYNLNVYPQHTYIVEGIRVHNGGGGKSSGGGTARAAVEQPNNLRSTNIAHVMEVVSEGPIEGLTTNSLKDVYFNDTQVQNDSGAYNFGVAKASFRVGLPSQPNMIHGYSGVENVISVNTVLTYYSPVIRALQSTTDLAYVQIRFPNGLHEQNTTNGDLYGAGVQLAFDYKRTTDGSWINYYTTPQNMGGKTMSTWDWAYFVQRPSSWGDVSWEVRVRRLNPDSTSAAIVNDTYVYQITEVQYVPYSYDNVAYVGMSLDAQSVGNTIPNRSYDIKGLLCQIPSNYNPITRSYSGTWNGLFNTAWTDNPAWVVYDLLTNPRYGMGEFIDATMIDKWSFYSAAQYNDALVPDGNGGTEPRFTFNQVIQTREDCWKLIQSVASSMRAVVIPGGIITLVQDRPTSPVKLVNNSNVKDGIFTYTGSGFLTRQTAVNVTYSDKDDRYLPKITTVENTAGISRYGYNTADIVAYGATTEGQAIRAGKWYLDTQLNQTEMVSYEVGFNQADVIPGDIVSIMDNDYAAANFAGRIVSASGTSITLDSAITIQPSKTYTLTFLDADGDTIQTRTITTGSGTYTTVNVSVAFPNSGVGLEGREWMISATGVVEARQFKIVSMKEQEKGIFAISAVFHDPNKYARVENGIVITPPVYSVANISKINPVTGIYAQFHSSYDAAIGQTFDLWVEWTKPSVGFVDSYRIRWSRENGVWSELKSQTSNVVIPNVKPGIFKIQVIAINVNGASSAPTLATIDAGFTNSSNLLPPDFSITSGHGSGTTFSSSLLYLNINPANNSEVIGETVAHWFFEFRNLGGTLLHSLKIAKNTPTVTVTVDELNKNAVSGTQIVVRSWAVNTQDKMSTTYNEKILTAAPPSVPYGLSAGPSIGGVNLNWQYTDVTASNTKTKGTEIWVSLTNNRANATLLGEYPSKSAVHIIGNGTNQYYWVRNHSIFDTYSDFYPASVTGGISAIAPKIQTVDVKEGAVSEIEDYTYPGLTELTSYFTGMNQISIPFTGTGEPVIIDTNYQLFHDDVHSNPGLGGWSDVVQEVMVTDVTSGGSVTNTGWMPPRNYALYDNGGDGQNWTNISNCMSNTSDGTFATCAAGPGGYFDVPYFYDFDFSGIPLTSTIIDIQIRIGMKTSSGNNNVTVGLCWNTPTDFTNTGPTITSRYNLVRTATTTNTDYVYPEDYNVSYPSVLETSWGQYIYGSFFGPDFHIIDAAALKTTNFGLYVWPSANTGTTMSIDSVSMKVFYSTKKIIGRQTDQVFKLGIGDTIQRQTSATTSFIPELGKTYNYELNIYRGRRRYGSTYTLPEMYTFLYDKETRITKLKR